MSRRLPKPWSRTRPGGKVEWYVTVTENGKQRQKFLAEGADIDPEELQRKLILLLAEVNLHKPGTPVTYVAVMNQYLDFVQANQSARTYTIRHKALRSFRQHLEQVGLGTIGCQALLPIHVTQWLGKKVTWGVNMRRLAIMSVKTCVSWAYEQGILNEKPLARLKQMAPRLRGQEVILTAEQRQLLLDFSRYQCQKDLLMALYGSGCRPSELCNLRVEDVYLDQNPPVWLVRGKPTKHFPDGVRLVALTPTLVEITQRLLDQNNSGPLFRNRWKRAWNRNSIGQFMRRLRERIKAKGHRLPAKVIAYGLRHCYATDMLAGGAHDYDVAKLMGHTDTTMVHHVYAKHSVTQAARALNHLNEVKDGGRKPEPPGAANAPPA